MKALGLPVPANSLLLIPLNCGPYIMVETGLEKSVCNTVQLKI